MEIIEGIAYHPDIKTAVMFDSGRTLFEEKDLKEVAVDKYKIAPWGADNNFPLEVRTLIEASDVMSTNITFNRDVCYGLGPKLVRLIKNTNGKVVDYVELDSGAEYDWYIRNDISMFLLEQLTDLVTYHNAFPELIPEESGNKIYSLRHKEAMFSRWAMMDKKGNIPFHYYCGDWESPTKDTVTQSKVIDDYDALTNIKSSIALKKQRMIFPIYMPSPGRPYYSRPGWYSLFESGWYDHSVSIPLLKKAIMKNNLGVKYIVYVAEEYFEDIIQKEGIDKSNLKAVKTRIDTEKKAFNDFLSGEKNAGKAILALKNWKPVGNSVTENKYIEIVEIKNSFDGGEYLPDVETCANIMCYAMGVHPSLIGATPGKGGNSFSGTDKRELFMMKQALMKPVVDRVMRPLQLVKLVNGWASDVTILMPEFVFTTLDKNKSGKEESISKTS